MSTGLASPLKYHGGKSYLASRIVALMPDHRHYVEPYAGGLSVLLQKNFVGVSEVVNDLDGELTNFWLVLQDENLFAKFVRKVQACPFTELQWRRAVAMSDQCRDLLARGFRFSDSAAVSYAWSFFLRCRQSLAGRMNAFAPLSKTRTRQGMNEQAAAWLTAVKGLPEVHARLSRVVILNRDALSVIRQQDGPDVLQYLDPPYVATTRTAAEVYRCEADESHHRQLLSLITSGLQSKFVISGYRCPLYDEALSKWHRVDFEIANHAAGGESKRRMTESVWTNFPAGNGSTSV